MWECGQGVEIPLCPEKTTDSNVTAEPDKHHAGPLLSVKIQLKIKNLKKKNKDQQREREKKKVIRLFIKFVHLFLLNPSLSSQDMRE